MTHAHLGEVEGHVEIVVEEGLVLLRVEHFEERGGRVALPAVSHLVDLCHRPRNDRVSRRREASLMHCMEHKSWHEARVPSIKITGLADLRFFMD
jgi:hypothetical protein